MDSAKPEKAETGAARPGPGRLLQQARQDLRLAPEDVARILHLSPKQIIALEKDDYQTLPGPTYVRGYLRGYAQLLGLSPEKVVEAYNGLMIASRPITLPQSAPPPQITSSDHIVKAATVGVAAVLLGLVYLWWQSGDERMATMPVTAPPAHTEHDSHAVLSGGVPPAAAPAGAAGLAAGTEPPSPPSAAAGTASTPAGAAPTMSSDGRLTVSGMSLNVAPAEPAATRTRHTADIPPGAPRARLILHAVEESWADIRDARDTRLLYENVPAGRRVSIEGVAPLSVFLGNADGVRVEFNGQNYDVSRHKRGQVARFTLGEEAAVNN